MSKPGQLPHGHGYAVVAGGSHQQVSCLNFREKAPKFFNKRIILKKINNKKQQQSLNKQQLMYVRYIIMLIALCVFI